MGAEHKKLGVPGEQELSGAGVSYCATCDAAFFKDQVIMVVGGGDSALEEAMFLAKFGRKVVLVHRRDELRASKIMQDRARAMENIEFKTPYVVESFLAGDGPFKRIARLKHSATDATEDVEIGGAFIAIGHEPQSRDRRRRDRHRRRGLRQGRRPLDPDQRARASSPPATSSTTPTARRSPPRAPAARPRSTPSGTCATPRRSRRRPPSRRAATSPRRSGRPRPRPPSGAASPSSSS